MEYKRDCNRIYLRLDKGDEIFSSVMKTAEAEKIKAGSVSGIGATDDFTVGIFDIGRKKYNEFAFSGNHEICALTGNLSTMNGEEYVHLHITAAGESGNTVGGHLLKGFVSLTCEIVIDITETGVGRFRDEDLGINRWNFD